MNPNPKLSRGKHKQTLCWECQRAAAPESLQCEWSHNLKAMPEGAIWEEWDNQSVASSRSRFKFDKWKVIISCPKFVHDADDEFRALIKQERKKFYEAPRSSMKHKEQEHTEQIEEENLFGAI